MPQIQKTKKPKESAKSMKKYYTNDCFFTKSQKSRNRNVCVLCHKFWWADCFLEQIVTNKLQKRLVLIGQKNYIWKFGIWNWKFEKENKNLKAQNITTFLQKWTLIPLLPILPHFEMVLASPIIKIGVTKTFGLFLVRNYLVLKSLLITRAKSAMELIGKWTFLLPW